MKIQKVFSLLKKRFTLLNTELNDKQSMRHTEVLQEADASISEVAN
jgi:hypothetical protein